MEKILNFFDFKQMVLMHPHGIVAVQEKHLMIDSILLMLLIVVPVILLTFIFARKYRETNTKADYKPNWAHSYALEAVCWLVPCVIIAVLAVITWVSTHKLDPYRPLAVKGKPLTIQAIALEWRWLFIYPEQKIATINTVEFPVNRQVRFLVTSDAPMNAFVIPELAGQIYAMNGMRTQLHLIANKKGTYTGLSTNYSGDGFSGMFFKAHVTSRHEFNRWVQRVKASNKKLTFDRYNHLADPSKDEHVQYFNLASQNLFHMVIAKFMKPAPHRYVHKVKQHA